MSEGPKASSVSMIARLARAAASAEADEPETALPRLLRYAIAADDYRPHLRTRLLQEILTLAPEVREIAERWAGEPTTHCCILATALDALAYEADKPALVTLADTVLLLGLSDEPEYTLEHRRVAAALTATVKAVGGKVDEDLRAKLDSVVLGWAVLAAAIDTAINTSAARAASTHSVSLTQWISRVEARRWEREQEREAAARKEEEERTKEEESRSLEPPAVAAEGAVRVCDLSDADAKNKKLKELLVGYEHVIGCDVPLAATPDIAAVRATPTLRIRLWITRFWGFSRGVSI